jgi:hypothetical protein
METQYRDVMDVGKLEWVIENAPHLNLGASYVKGQLVTGDAQVSLLKKYLKRAIQYNGLVPVEYYQLDGDGRRFSKDLSLTNISRPVRHTIVRDNVVDIDMKNAHPALVLHLCERHGLTCTYIKQYVMNREPLLTELMTTRGLSRDNAKKMLLRAINRDDGRFQQTEADPEWLVKYHEECKTISNTLSSLYPDYLTQAKKSKERKNQEAWNLKGSALNRLLCHHEDQLLRIVERVVTDMGWKVLNLAYDGCMIGSNGRSASEQPAILRAIENAVQATPFYNGMQFEMTIKRFDEGYAVPQGWISERERKVREKQEREYREERKQTDDDIKEQRYQDWKVDFELEHAKIMFPRSIVFRGPRGDFLFYSPNDLIDSLSHVPYFKEHLTRWNKDPTLRVYDLADIYAPSETCPPTVFNLWTPYPFEYTEVKETEELVVQLEFVKAHIGLLCNHEEAVTTYVLDWIAQFIQFPQRKSTMLTFASAEGAGKNTLVDLISGMIGHGQVRCVTDPELICGRFNSTLLQGRLIVLNEMSDSQTRKYDGRIKELITDTSIEIEGKGKDSITIRSMHRLISFTNAINNPIQTTHGDRRKLLARCSDERVGDGDYFTKLHTIIGTPEFLAYAFHHFKNRDVAEFNLTFGRSLPKTEYQQTIAENDRDPIELWLIDLANREEYDKQPEPLQWTSQQQLQSCQDFFANSGFKMEFLNVQRLSVRIANMKVDGIRTKHTGKGNVRVFDMKKVRQYFMARMAKV